MNETIALRQSLRVAMIFLSVAMMLAYGMRRPGPLKRWRLYLIR